MPSVYDIRLLDYNGSLLPAGLNAFSEMDIVLVENDMGVVSLSISADVDPTFLKKDNRLAIYRSVNGRLPYLVGDCTWLIRRRKRTISGKDKSWKIWAYHPNYLLKKRIIAYNAGTSQTSKAQAADNMLKELVRENLGSSATDTDRILSSTIFSVENNVSAGPTVAKSFTRRNLLKVCQEIAQTAAQLGTYVGFEIFSPVESTYAFRTYVGQRGVDRSSDSSSPLYVELDDVVIDDDWTEEINFVYAGGTGIEADRAIGTAEDTSLSSETPFGRAEYFWDGRQTDDVPTLDNDAQALLRANRPRKMISGNIKDTPAAALGVHYNWGDIVSFDVDGDVRDVRIERVRLHSDSEDGETVDIAVLSE